MAADFGAAAVLFVILGYVAWQFVIRRLRKHNNELKEKNQKLRDRLMEARKDKWAEENEQLQDRIDNLLERIQELKNEQ